MRRQRTCCQGLLTSCVNGMPLNNCVEHSLAHIVLKEGKSFVDPDGELLATHRQTDKETKRQGLQKSRGPEKTAVHLYLKKRWGEVVKDSYVDKITLPKFQQLHDIFEADPGAWVVCRKNSVLDMAKQIEAAFVSKAKVDDPSFVAFSRTSTKPNQAPKKTTRSAQEYADAVDYPDRDQLVGTWCLKPDVPKVLTVVGRGIEVVSNHGRKEQIQGARSWGEARREYFPWGADGKLFVVLSLVLL